MGDRPLGLQTTSNPLCGLQTLAAQMDTSANHDNGWTTSHAHSRYFWRFAPHVQQNRVGRLDACHGSPDDPISYTSPAQISPRHTCGYGAAVAKLFKWTPRVHVFVNTFYAKIPNQKRANNWISVKFGLRRGIPELNRHRSSNMAQLPFVSSIRLYNYLWKTYIDIIMVTFSSR